MLPFALQSILLSAAMLVFVKFCVSYTNKKKLPPSPLALPFIGHLYLFKKPLHHALTRISEKYGPITFLRFGVRPVVVISSRSLAEECFTTHDMALANRPQFPSNKLHSGSFILIGASNYGPYWRSARRVAAVELLSPQRLHASSDIRAREVKDMARRLFESWKTSLGLMHSNGLKRLELKTILFELSFNVLMTMIMGKRFYGDELEDLEEGARFRVAVEERFALSAATNIEDFLPALRWLDLKGVLKKKARLLKHEREMVVKLFEDHRKISDGTRKTMIGQMLELQKKDPEEYSDPKIQAITLTMLFAGADTTANTLEWAMTNLLNNPEVLKKVAAEIEEYVGNERLLEESDIAHIPYLQCILREVLRLYPGAPLLIPHESREDVTIAGYSIPRKTMVLVNAYQIHRDPDLWDEPLKFKPERFANGNTEGQWMIPFGMGRRRCPGEGLAMRELGLILGTLIQCFDWERTGNELVDLTEGSSLTLPKAVPLEAMYRPRENMIKFLSGLQSPLK